MLLQHILLIKRGDFLIRVPVSPAKTYSVSEPAIKLTLVVFCTSVPKLTVNITYSINKLNDIIIKNIDRSNPFDLILIPGISGLIYPNFTQVNTVKKIPFISL